ncbi:MAG: NADH:flavin oxidoreductase/NADH oxidase [Chloroflexi bacterium]|nr:NADH:flavin oxidoreductase/NADH oxidase [Chloroflexota bacterium]
MTHLFDTFTLRGVTFRNRIGVSPMCQYSSEDGFATDWHLVHLGARAVGGAGLVIVEASAVQANGRISPHDLGIWQDEHVAKLRSITEFMASQGAVPGIQLAHAGRKANTARPWEGGQPLPNPHNSWQIVAPSAMPFRDGYPTPHELTLAEIEGVKQAFCAATQRAVQAGFKLIEIHAAHGYLLHNFYSPIANQRQDAYGGSFDNRIRLLLEVVQEVRLILPDDLPLTVRISSTDWVEGGWDVEDSIELAKRLKQAGVDLVDCSSGGNVATAKIPIAPGYQVGFAQAVRERAGIATAAVGLITQAEQAEQIIASEQADLVLLARELLRDPYWPLHAAQRLNQTLTLPPQYARAF